MKNQDSFKVGVISFILIGLVAVLLLWKSNLFLRTTGYEVLGRFDNISGLLAGAEVRYRGYNVGRVVSIDPNPEYVEARFYVRQETEIPVNSRLKVDFDGLIGEKFIQIMPNTSSSEMIRRGSVLKGFANAGISDFVEIGAQNLVETKKILKHFRDIIGEEGVTESMSLFLLNLEKISTNIGDITDQLGTDDLSQIVTDLREIVSILKQTTDDVFVEGEFSSRITGIVQNVSDLSERIEDKRVMDNVDRILENFVGFSDFLNIGNQLTWVPVVDVFKLNDADRDIYQVNVDIAYGDRFFRFGVGNEFFDVRLFNFQQGFKFSNDFSSRVGVLYNEFGFGLDYRLMGFWDISLELFNVSEPEFVLSNAFQFNDYVSLFLRLSQNEDHTQYDNVGVGIRLKP